MQAFDESAFKILNNIVEYRARQMIGTDEKRARSIFRQIQLGRRKFHQPDATWLYDHKLAESSGKVPEEIAACIDLFLKSL